MRKIFFLLFLTSCMSSKIHFYKSIDLSDKSVTLPPGGVGLMSDVKQALILEGWQVKIDRGLEVIGEKASGSSKYDSLHTRYRVHQNVNAYDVCVTGGQAISFDISMVDNKDSSEVFTWSGRTCSGDFMQELRRIARGEHPKYIKTNVLKK
jgi:hypothetical protein